jgi:hypothetical protein
VTIAASQQQEKTSTPKTTTPRFGASPVKDAPKQEKKGPFANYAFGHKIEDSIPVAKPRQVTPTAPAPVLGPTAEELQDHADKAANHMSLRIQLAEV